MTLLPAVERFTAERAAMAEGREDGWRAAQGGLGAAGAAHVCLLHIGGQYYERGPRQVRRSQARAD